MTTGQDTRRSIRTRYNGTLYRSKLEADWAITFDALGVLHQYEKEGRYFGRQFYLPDFFLPRSRQFVEVKAVFDDQSCQRIAAALQFADRRPHVDNSRTDIVLVACMPDGVFVGWERSAASSATELIARAMPVDLLRCAQCAGWWFCDPAMSWGCQCCGFYDGGRCFIESIQSPLPEFPRLSRPVPPEAV